MGDRPPPRRDIFDYIAFPANIAIAIAAVAAAFYTAKLWRDAYFNSRPQLDVAPTINHVGKVQMSYFTISNPGDYPATNISILFDFRQLRDQRIDFPSINERPAQVILRLGKGNARMIWLGTCWRSNPLAAQPGDQLLVYLCYDSVSGEHQPADEFIFSLVYLGDDQLAFTDYNGVKRNDYMDAFWDGLKTEHFVPGGSLRQHLNRFHRKVKHRDSAFGCTMSEAAERVAPNNASCRSVEASGGTR
jgi:hypothetical protein